MLSVVIPVFNEEKNIDFVLSEILEYIDKQETYEIIFVDDHSNDNTYLHIRDLNFSNKNIKVIRLSRRSGSHIATKAGIDSSKGDKVLVISGDGQEDPSLIANMASKIEEGVDIVWGVREARSEPLISRFITNIFYKGLKRFTKKTISYSVDISNADFYMINSRVIKVIKETSLLNTSLFGLLAWIGFKQESIKYKRRERANGITKWGVKSKISLALDWYIGFSPSPLRFVMISGLLITILAIGYTVAIFIFYMNGTEVQGWSSIVVLILFFNSFIILVLGLFGEYLWRTFNNTSDRPNYAIEDQVT